MAARLKTALAGAALAVALVLPALAADPAAARPGRSPTQPSPTAAPQPGGSGEEAAPTSAPLAAPMTRSGMIATYRASCHTVHLAPTWGADSHIGFRNDGVVDMPAGTRLAWTLPKFKGLTGVFALTEALGPGATVNVLAGEPVPIAATCTLKILPN